jgi:hypothetical protein
VGEYFPGTLEDGQMCDNLEIFGEVLGLFWCFVYLIITSVILMNAGLW